MTSHPFDDDRVSEYVAGTLPPADVEEFEQHLLECATCRDAVRLGATTRAALRADRGSAPRRPVPTLLWLPVAAGIVIAVFAAQREPTVALGGITPAPFEAGALRPSTDSATALVDSGMRAYVARDFGGAAALLTRAARVDQAPPVQFFLGVALLMLSRDGEALNALRRVPGESPYGEEAVYYAAKALVRLHHTDSALMLLDRAPPTESGGRLRTFADSLRRR